MTRRAARLVTLPLTALLVLGGCSDAGGGAADPAAPSQTGTAAEQRFPEIVAVEASQADDGTFDFAVTISSPYDSPDRYADGWRILGENDEVYGEMTLGHDHASEQPFTRTQTGVEIPADVDTVEVEGHDTDNGYGGRRVTVELPGR
jgi:hypothetical protein